MAKNGMSRNRKIGFTIIMVVVGIVLIALLSGGIELGNFKLPSFGYHIKVTIDIHNGIIWKGVCPLCVPILDIDFVGEPKFEIVRFTFATIQQKPFGIFFPDLEGKKARVIMYIDGENCNEKEVTKYLGVKKGVNFGDTETVTISCKADKGLRIVRLELWDDEGLEDKIVKEVEVK